MRFDRLLPMRETSSRCSILGRLTPFSHGGPARPVPPRWLPPENPGKRPLRQWAAPGELPRASGADRRRRFTKASMRRRGSSVARASTTARMPCWTASAIGSRSQSAHQLLLEPDRAGAGGADRRDPALHRGVQLAGGHQPVEKATAMRLLGVDHLAGEDQLAGLAPADQARQQAGLHARGDAELHLGHAEARGLHADAHVAGGRDLHAGPQAVAVHAGDDGDGQPADGVAGQVGLGADGLGPGADRDRPSRRGRPRR